MNPELPYPSQRLPVGASNMVATSQPLAAQAGVEAMRKGGNAVDAAIAAAITLAIVEPTSNGIGSDAFAILWDGSKLVGLNASGRAPQGWTREYFGSRQTMPQFGWDSVTVPGAVSAWVALSERYGVLPFKDLFGAGIHYAAEGFQVGSRTAWHWQNDPASYEQFPDFAKHFLPAPSAGERVRLPAAARTLELIAQSNGEAFYHGELAEKIEAAAIAQGGAMRKVDLAAHKAEWVEPLAQNYREVTLHEIPPNGQGIAAQIALGILDNFEPAACDSAEAMHLQIEAMKIALRSAAEHVADIETMRLSPAELLDAKVLSDAAARIGDKALPVPPFSVPSSPDTVYLSAADASGMMVSFIQSNYYGFGSGIVVSDTGIALQNRGFGFSLDEGHPNCVGPGKRPFHTIIPGFVTRGGKPTMSFGVMGGPMQAQGHLQMMTRVFDYGQNPQAASDAPRWQVLDDFSVLLEPGFSPAVADQLADKGHAVRFDDNNRAFGGAQLILKTAHGYIGATDHRKEGQVAGF